MTQVIHGLTLEKRQALIATCKDILEDITSQESWAVDLAEIALPVLEQQEQGDGEWIEWGGGECPVPHYESIEVRFREKPQSGGFYNIRYSVYQRFGGVMEVSRTHPDRNAMYTTTIDEDRAMRNTWTTENLDILIRDYATTATDLLASLFDKPRQQVTNKARELGLKKSPEYLESVRAATGGMRCRDANNTLRA